MRYQLTPHFFFFFNDTATTEIYTLSLHDALPICKSNSIAWLAHQLIGLKHNATEVFDSVIVVTDRRLLDDQRSEEHTSELQSRQYLVCRLLLEKKKSQIQLSKSYFVPPAFQLLVH